MGEYADDAMERDFSYYLDSDCLYSRYRSNNYPTSTKTFERPIPKLSPAEIAKKYWFLAKYTILAETDRAFLVKFSRTESWIPKSQAFVGPKTKLLFVSVWLIKSNTLAGKWPNRVFSKISNDKVLKEI